MARNPTLADERMETPARTGPVRRRISEIRNHLGRPQAGRPSAATSQSDLQLLHQATHPARRITVSRSRSSSRSTICWKRGGPPDHRQPTRHEHHVGDGVSPMRSSYASLRSMQFLAGRAGPDVSGEYRRGLGTRPGSGSRSRSGSAQAYGERGDAKVYSILHQL